MLKNKDINSVIDTLSSNLFTYIMTPSLVCIFVFPKNKTMSIIETALYQDITNYKTVSLGQLFFFKNYMVAEFNEGVEINYENFEEVRELMHEHFGDENFGFISNRINSYSIVITDAPRFNECQTLKAYATVTYSLFAEKVFNVENYFFNFNKQNFHSLIKAQSWIEETLEASKQQSLN